MSKKISIYYKVLLILCFISIAIFNFLFSFPSIGTLECKHDIIKDILELIARCLEYIELVKREVMEEDKTLKKI